MTVESPADRLSLLADFGVTVSWSPGAGDPVEIVALFDNATHSQARFAEELPVIVSEATLTLRAADLPVGAARGDAVTVTAVAYLVEDIMPDGQGLASVHLERDHS